MSAPAATAIAGGLIVDGTGAAPVRDGLVLIEGERIAFVGRAGERAIPQGATVIDAAGASVLPGLMDVHVHISMSAPSEWKLDHYKRSFGRIAFELAANLRQTVAAGVTTIRTVSDVGHLDIAARDATQGGLVPGPRIFPCGKGMTSTGGHGQKLPCWICMSHGEVCEIVDGVDAIRLAIRNQARAGAQWIKIFQTGGVVDKHGRIDAEEFAPSEFEAAIETAALLDLPVAVHAHNKPAILRSIRAGCRSIEHGMDFDAECAEAAAAHGTFLVPTLTVMERIVRLGPTNGVPAHIIANDKQRTDRHRVYVKQAYDMGVQIVTGTDAGSILTPHGAAGHEVVQLVACGIPVLDAIRAATQTTAKLLKADQWLGTLEAGKIADIIVVEGDVAAAPQALTEPEQMRRVLIGGREIAAQGRVMAA